MSDATSTMIGDGDETPSGRATKMIKGSSTEQIERNDETLRDQTARYAPRPPLPGWPAVVDSPVAWDGAEFRHDEQYTYLLSSDDIKEIEGALQYFKGLGLYGWEISRDNFPLPNLSVVIRALAEDLHFGRGFFALRGLNPDNYTREDNTLIFLGVSSHVGERKGKQDDKGHIFAHIREAQFMRESQAERPVRDSNVASAFHTDLFCDILAMQTRSLPAHGGNHIVASTAKVYNELVRTRPDIIRVLAAPNWPFDTRGKLTPPSIRPLLFHHGGRLLMNFVRDPLRGLPWIARSPGLPRLTPAQDAALDAVQVLAQRHQRALAMRPGDLTFVNNLCVLHAREAFEDSDGQFRYLVRLWLRDDELALPLPPELEEGNRRVFDDDGLVAEDWNIVFKPRLQFDIGEKLSP